MMRATVAVNLAFREADQMRLLYGGSVKPFHAKELMANQMLTARSLVARA